jgi:osmotically-inducible protein OsmY
MNIKQRTRLILAVSAAAFGLAACGRPEPPTVGQQVDKAIMQTQQAAKEANKDMKAAAENVRQEASQAANDFAQGANDAAITAKVKAVLAADKQLSALAINVDTDNKVVSLSGPAPTPESAHRAATLAKGVDGVTGVKNHLMVMVKG